MADLRPAREPIGSLLLGAFATALSAGFFFFLFWNKFAGLRSGDGGFVAGNYFIQGILPYRDYFAPGPPLALMKSALLLQVFGGKVIVLRAAGVLERIALGVLVYWWMARFFRVTDAGMAAMVAIIVSAGDPTDPISSYNHDAILFATSSAFVASFVVTQTPTLARLLACGILSGMTAGLCFATKQTVGIGATAVIPCLVAIFLLRSADLRMCVIFLTSFAVGYALSAGVLALWLVHEGILRPFINQAFVVGPAAKVSAPGDFLAHSIIVIRHEPRTASIGFVSAVAMWFAVRGAGPLHERQNNQQAAVLLPFIITIAAIAIGASTSLHGRGTIVEHSFSRPTIYLVLFGSALTVLGYSWRLLVGVLSPREMNLCLMAAVAFVVAFMLSLSYPAFEAMVIPGLALFVASILNAASREIKLLIYAACGVLIYGVTCTKLDMPFEFEGWAEPPVRNASIESVAPAMQGITLPSTTTRFIDETLRVISAYPPTETIFTYPEFGIIYGLSGRKFPTFSGSHNIDVANDQFVRDEAKRLLNARPAVLVFGTQPEAYLVGQEELWRRGRPSAQRDLIVAMQQLAAEYHLVETFQLPPYNREVKLYARP